MSSSINLYDNSGNPQTLTGDMVKELLGIDSKQLATAWGEFNGQAVTITSGYNFGSVVRPNTGVFDITFDTPMDNTNYVVATTSNQMGVSERAFYVALDATTPKTVNGFRLITSQGAVEVDIENNEFVVFGGKN